MKSFNKVNQQSALSGKIRSYPEDFQVDEIMPFTPSGEGEHVWLHIRKTGENTDWVAGQLAKIAAVPRKDVSYAGMKDRHAVTTQWFSVQMPGREAPSWQENLPESIQIIEEQRHERKLKRGALQGNQFKIVVRQFKGSQEELDRAVEQIKKHGVPNYYGEQRFGHDGMNIRKAEQWFKGEFKIKGRAKRSIYLSAARSWIFNHILSERVAQGNWNQPIEGDVFILNNSNSCFLEPLSDAIEQRIKQKDLHPSGPLWGRGRLRTEAAALALEKLSASQFEVLCEGLERNGLKQERKALRLDIDDLDYTYTKEGHDGAVISLTFTLPAGAFATSVLAEIGDFY